MKIQKMLSLTTTASPITPLKNKTIRIGWLAIFLILWIIPCLSNDVQGGEKNNVRVGGEYDYPPYCFIDPNGSPAGFSVELTGAIARTMGFTVDIHLGPWAEARKALEDGRIDVILAMFYSAERARVFDFSTPYSIVNNAIFTRKGSPAVQSIEDLRDKEIIVMDGEIMHDYVIEHQLSARLLLSKTPQDAMQMLSEGKGEYALIAHIPGLYWVKKQNLTNIVTVGPPVMSFKNCFAMHPGNAGLVQKFNEGLNILYQTGEYQRLYDKWLGVLKPSSITFRQVIKYSSLVVIPLLILLAMSLLWSSMLRARVKQKTAALKNSETLFRTLFEQAAVGVAKIETTTGKFQIVNQRYCEIVGYTFQEMMALDFQTITHLEDLQADIEQMHRLAVGEIQNFSMEKRYWRKDGEIVWVLLTVSPMWAPGEEPDFHIAVVEDISDLKKTEAQLIAAKENAEESERRLRTLSDNIPYGLVYQIDSGVDARQHRFSYISAGVEHLHGITVAEAINDPIAIYGQILEADRQQLAEREALAASQMMPFHTEARVRLPSGEVRWRLFISAPRRLPNDHLVWDGIEIDITERKQVETSLAEERERLMVTLRSIGDGVITTDTQSRIVLINTIAEELTGWRQQDAAGKYIHEVFHIIDERTRQQCANPIEKVIATGMIIELANGTILVSRDGTERIIADSGAPIRNQAGHVIGVVLVFRDVTARVAMEAELQQAQKLESIGILAGGIAHDFNNMLGIIAGNISLALSQMHPKDMLFESLKDVQTGTRQAQQLTQQLLTFAKGGAPVKKAADLGEVLKESALFITRGSKALCEFDIPQNLWSVAIDIGQMNQAIGNLVINAAQAMPEGGIIQIRAENKTIGPGDHRLLSPGKYFKIIIEDNGIGIAEKHVAKIFDPYFTTKHQGRGLGLATTYSIIKKHNGHIAVESEIGKGTTFYIHLPATDAKPAIGPRKAGDGRPGHGNILIMDDQEMILDMSRRLLEMLGYETAFAKNGRQAIEMYANALRTQKPFDIVILDLTVPGGMGGAETIPKLLKIDPAVKAIVSSGYSNDPIMAHYQDYGFQGVLPKPFTIADMEETLGAILRKT